MNSIPPSPTEPALDPSSESAALKRRRVFMSVWGALLVGAILLFREVLLPFLLATVLAYVLAPLVRRLERVRVASYRMPRWGAVLSLYVVLLGLIALFLSMGVPRLVVEIERIGRDAPQFVRTVRDEWLPEFESRLRSAIAPYEAEPVVAVSPPRIAKMPAQMDGGVEEPPEALRIVPSESGGFEVRLPPGGIVVTPENDRFRITSASRHMEERPDLTATLTDALGRTMENTEEHALTILKTAQAVIRAVVKSIFTFSIVLMLSAYLLVTHDRILAFFRSLVQPSRRASFDRLLHRIDRGLSGVVRGQVLICLVNGVLSGIGFYLFDLDYWPVLTLIATVLSIVPIFGSIVSSIPAVLIGLQQSFSTALLVLAWIVGIHQVEANFLNPKIMGDAAKVHPVLVVFALLAGEHLFGIAGALLAVPVLSIVQSLFLHYREAALGVPAPQMSLAPPPGEGLGPGPLVSTPATEVSSVRPPRP